MDVDDFDDLFDEVDLLPPSSQGSLINAATNLDLHRQDEARNTCDAYNLNHSKDDHTLSQSSPPQGSNLAHAIHEAPYPKYSSSSATARTWTDHSSADAIDKIEAVFEQMTDVLLNDKHEISVTLKTRRQASRPSSRVRDDQDAPSRTLCFPGKSADEAWRFTVVVRILELMHEALRNTVVISKRDMYYRDPALFGSQTHVDRYVDDIAYTFSIPRSALNVVAAAKGLFAGAVKLWRKSGSVVDAASDREGMLVPNLKDVLSVDMKAVRWILVIEKEATFRSIAASAFWDKIATEGVVVTGKGYPDLSTRGLLNFLATPSPRNGFASPAVHGLADYDPDGIAILSTYKCGSKALRHESANHVVPGLQWLGLRSQHLHMGQGNTHAKQGLLSLTTRDRRKAIRMLEDSVDDDRRRELQTMLMLNVKAELQLLDSIPNGMANLLASRLCHS